MTHKLVRITKIWFEEPDPPTHIIAPHNFYYPQRSTDPPLWGVMRPLPGVRNLYAVDLLHGDASTIIYDVLSRMYATKLHPRYFLDWALHTGIDIWVEVEPHDAPEDVQAQWMRYHMDDNYYYPPEPST